jgi:hypothetical protein
MAKFDVTIINPIRGNEEIHMHIDGDRIKQNEKQNAEVITAVPVPTLTRDDVTCNNKYGCE